MKVLEEFNVESVFLVPGWVTSRYTNIVGALVEKEHGVAGRGYIHERIDELRLEDDVRVFNLTKKPLEEVTGKNPSASGLHIGGGTGRHYGC